jgi:acetyl esterase/lipase
VNTMTRNRGVLVPGALALALALGASSARAAEPLPVRNFALHPEFSLVRLSPNGEYIAAVVRREADTSLAIFRLSDMKVTAGLVEKDIHVNGIVWVGPKRVVVTFAQSTGSLDAPTPTGKLAAIDADGANPKRLYGFEGPGVVDGYAYIGANIVAARTKNPDEILISLSSIAQLVEGRMTPTVHRLNTRTGRSFGVADSPVGGFTYFLADQDGELRYAAGEDDQLVKGHIVNRTFVRDSQQTHPRKQWSEVGNARPGRTVIPMAFSKDGSRVYVQARDGTDAYCLSEQVLAAGTARTLACHPRADLDRVFFSADGDVPVAAVFEQGVPEIAWLNPEHPDTKLLRSLSASFPGQVVEPTSWSDDGSKLVFVVRSDRNPGEYYLYDRKTGSARFLLAQRPWIDAAKMAQVKALTVKSRSGAEVYGYLTLPPGKPASKLPMVVMPHGGPIGPRDRWEWDSDAQFFASRGYAVLQVNFHGSGGYGYKYQEAGRGVWGTLMIDDITDAVRATIADGTADASRICIYGGSYGGYASLMSAAREPDLYQCAIPYVGVFDLAMLKRDTDIASYRGGRTFMDLYIGDDAADLAKHSPINYLGTLRAPVFIVHGEKDPRAPFNQAKLLRAKLEERKHPYEWLSKPKEGHGFYNVDNRTELYQKMEDFLDRHIGERRPAKPQ